MRTVRLALLAVCAATLLSGSALAQGQKSLTAPQGLKPFLLRASEPAAHDFPRTPSFSWTPVRGATRYSFQLSKTPNFQDGTIFWANSGLKGPAVAIPLTLPWMTGEPYAVYARVRAITATGVTPWSTGYGFNVSWQDVPKLAPSYPGLSRWTPVEGATSYQVWFTDVNRVLETRVNAVDQREFYAFHQNASFTGSVKWRVRAVRRVGKLQGFITPVNYGPWSPTFTSKNPGLADGVLRPVAAVTALATSTATSAKAHEMTPAFVFSGTRDFAGNPYSLYRVYVFSDKQCVNPVLRGAIVGSPAYAARNKGTLKLPTDDKAIQAASTSILEIGDEGTTYTAEGLVARPASEAGTASASSSSGSSSSGSTTSSGSSSSGSSSSGSSSSTSPPPAATTPVSDKATNSTWPQIELLESGWPNGRFYWTVVPVKLVPKVSSDGKTSSYTYVDAELPQDVCGAGRVMAFGKASTPVVAGQGTPYASGLSPSGRLIASVGSAPFYGHPLVAWVPVAGADTYEVEWSSRSYPWRAVSRIEVDGGTAATLPLKPGTWWYRIRGIDTALPLGRQTMTWSKPLQLKVAKPKFRLVASAR
jgi:uncharacterized membrane protein YgcG